MLAMLLVLTTVSTSTEAETLAEKIVTQKLAACVQILPPMTSVYAWEGKLQKESEHLLLIKTLREKYDEVEAFIIANHSYEVPEIIAVDPERISEKYANWLSQSLL